MFALMILKPNISDNLKSKFVIPLMAFSAGTVVANVYYSQPILKNIAETLNKSEEAVGRIAMLAQLGYGLGMFFLLPLGDKLNRKKLIITICCLLVLILDNGIGLNSQLSTILLNDFLNADNDFGEDDLMAIIKYLDRK